MPKQSSSAIVSGMDVVLSLVTSLVKEVKRLGGTDEDIYRLVTQEGEETLARIAGVIVGDGKPKVRSRIIATHIITCNGQKTSELVVLGNYDWHNPAVTDELFPVQPHPSVSRTIELVECDYEPDIVRLLIAKARWAYHIKDYKIAVLESFTSTDVCIEKHLISKHMKGGKTAQEAEDAIKGTSRIRLTNQFSQFHNKQFNKLFPSEYGCWEQLYISVRNPVAHKGGMPTAKEAEDSIIANEKIILCMQSLT